MSGHLEQHLKRLAKARADGDAEAEAAEFTEYRNQQIAEQKKKRAERIEEIREQQSKIPRGSIDGI